MQGGETLRDTGRLMNSYTHNVLSNGVEVGTDVAYAPHLHYGATILPKNGQYITFAVDGQYRKVKQSIIPPRTQLGIDAEDEVMVLDIVGSFIDEHLLRGT
jgi:Mu-like prophage protein gpG